MAGEDQLERLLNLIQLLLHTNEPLPLSRIVHEVPGYAENHAAHRGAFERDKKVLRAEGIDIEMVSIGDEDQVGYRIDPKRYYVPELDLTPEEQRALAVAVAGVADATGYGGNALFKIGEILTPDVPVIAQLEPPEHCAELYDAVRAKALVHLSYGGETRAVRPASVFTSKGRWYLAGYCELRAAVRVFRIDRIEGTVTVDGAGTAPWPPDVERPRGFNNLVADAADGGEDPDLVLEVDEVAASRVAMALGSDAAISPIGDDRSTVALRCTNEILARSFVLQLGARAVVVGPAPFRDEILEWLRGVAATRVAEGSAEVARLALAAPIVADPGPFTEEDPALKPRRMSGQDRLRRLLAMMTYLAQVGEAQIDELAARFGVSENEAIRDLERAACCGIPPYSPDALLEIVVDEDRVWARLPDEMAKPRRLSRKEGFALSAAAHLTIPALGDSADALVSAVAKLDAALGTVDAIDVEVEGAANLEVLRDACGARRLAITYYVPNRDQVTERTIDPIQVLLADGNAYVEAYCELARDVRLFRADRMRAIEDAGPRTIDLPEPRYTPDAISGFLDDAPTVVVHVDPSASWIADSVPSVSVEEFGDGSCEVELKVASARWLATLLLQAGSGARVVAPAAYVNVGADLADEVLANY